MMDSRPKRKTTARRKKNINIDENLKTDND